ncbi:hypothetical protein [Paraburkholderia aspalathi]|uniref:hypothetical protein n=1 Tax=Paraburkholderia aspalathi TaxID=1324617 RepID=UPI001B0FBCA7|nr:hypothetical protein [Paraburkholderia aspalathi]CAE6738479.1 hypothetical protein R20943_02302 [Paraburkholderia aspalathi]
MLATKVGIVDTTGTVDTQTMAAVAVVLNVRVTRDLPKCWPVNASVSYLVDPKKSRREYSLHNSSEHCHPTKAASI